MTVRETITMLADFGESIFLKLTIDNLGLTDAQNLYAKISSVSD